MFDLDRALGAWRKDAAAEGSLSTDDLDELADHLRARCEAHIRDGSAPVVAWAEARQSLGDVATLALEYRKVEGVWWRRLLRTAWAVFAVSWVMPVIGILGDSEPGYWAFWMGITGEVGVMGVVTGLTNAVMARTLWKPGDLRGPGLVGLTGATIACAAANAYWLALAFSDGGVSDLMIGYYMWWGSFVLAGAALALRLERFGARLSLLSVRWSGGS